MQWGEGQQQGLTSFIAARRAMRSAPSQIFSRPYFATQSTMGLMAALFNVIDQAVTKSKAARCARLTETKACSSFFQLRVSQSVARKRCIRERLWTSLLNGNPLYGTCDCDCGENILRVACDD